MTILKPLVQPHSTFGDLERQGLEIEVICQKCGRRTIIDGNAPALRDKQIAGRRYRCSRVLPDGLTCRGIGLPTVGKQRTWTRRAADHARSLRWLTKA